MALTFTDRLGGRKADMFGKQFRAYDVTHDGSETSMDASDFDLHYIDHAIATPGTVPLSATSAAFTDLTTNHGASLAFTALSSGAITGLWLIGW